MTAFLVVLALWILTAKPVLAETFTPSANLWYNQLDGAWEFPEENGLEFTAETELTVLEEVTDEIKLNNADEPQYLVSNNYQWSFSVANSQSVWLKMIYQPWSEETEAGFDEPYLVIFLNDQLFFKQNALTDCPSEEQCTEKTIQIYLGELSDEQVLNFYAGEMGDLEKPSGVIIKDLQLLTINNEKIQSNSTVSNDSSSNSSVKAQSSELIDQPAPAFTPKRETIDHTEPSKGKVLGATDEQETIPAWQAFLKELINEPYFVILLWLTIYLSGVLIWRKWQKRAIHKKSRLMSGLSRILKVERKT